MKKIVLLATVAAVLVSMPAAEPVAGIDTNTAATCYGSGCVGIYACYGFRSEHQVHFK